MIVKVWVSERNPSHGGKDRMPAQRKYSSELCERAVRMAVDARRDPATKPGAIWRIGEQLGINAETLRGWVQQAEIDGGDRPGTTTSDAARLNDLKKEVRELRRANAVEKPSTLQVTATCTRSGASVAASSRTGEYIILS
jgi:transposase-like protein